MDFGAQNGQLIEIEIPSWYPQHNAIDVYWYLLMNPYARWCLFDKVDQVRFRSHDIIVVTHPLVFLPFFFYPSSNDATFVRILESRIASPSIDDLYPV